MFLYTFLCSFCNFIRPNFTVNTYEIFPTHFSSGHSFVFTSKPSINAFPVGEHGPAALLHHFESFLHWCTVPLRRFPIDPFNMQIKQLYELLYKTDSILKSHRYSTMWSSNWYLRVYKPEWKWSSGSTINNFWISYHFAQTLHLFSSPYTLLNVSRHVRINLALRHTCCRHGGLLLVSRSLRSESHYKQKHFIQFSIIVPLQRTL